MKKIIITFMSLIFFLFLQIKNSFSIELDANINAIIVQIKDIKSICKDVLENKTLKFNTIYSEDCNVEYETNNLNINF